MLEVLLQNIRLLGYLALNRWFVDLFHYSIVSLGELLEFNASSSVK